MTFCNKWDFTRPLPTEPNPEDVCNFCEKEIGKQSLISGPDKISICTECVNLCYEIIDDRKTKARNSAIAAMMYVESGMTDSYQPQELMEYLFDAISEGQIPYLKLTD